MASGGSQVQILSYQPSQRSSNDSRSSASQASDSRELPGITSKKSPQSQLQDQQQQQPAKPKKKKATKPQKQQQQKSLSDTESRTSKHQNQQQQQQHQQLQKRGDWRDPNCIDYSDSNGRRRDQLEGINAPLLHRRLDAALQRIDRIGSPKKLKKEMQDLRQQFAELEAKIQGYQEMRDSLSYQQGVLASVNARLAKLETEMKRTAAEAGELAHLIRTPGALEDEQIRATREKINKKRQKTAGSSQAGGSKAN